MSVKPTYIVGTDWKFERYPEIFRYLRFQMRNDKTSLIVMNHSKDILSYPDGTGLETHELPNQPIYISSNNSLHAHTLFQSCIEIQRMDHHLSKKATYTAEQRSNAYSRLIASVKSKKSVPKLFDPTAKSKNVANSDAPTVDDPPIVDNTPTIDDIVVLFKDALQTDASNKEYNDKVFLYMNQLLLQVRTLLSDLIVTTDLMTKIISFQDSCDTLEARIKVMPAILYNIHWKIDNEFEIGTIPSVMPMRHEMGGTMVVTEIDTRTCIKILFVDCKFVNLYLQVWVKRLKSVEDLPTIMVLDDAHPTRDLAITNGAEIVEDVKQRFREAQQAAAVKMPAKEVSAAKSAEPNVSVNELLAAFGENVKPGSKSAAKGGGGGSAAAKGGGGGSAAKKGTVLEVVTAKAQQSAAAPIRVAAGGGGSLSAENSQQLKVTSSIETAISKERAKTKVAFEQYKAQKKAKSAAASISSAAAAPISSASSASAAPISSASSASAAPISSASSAATTNEPNASSSSIPYVSSAAAAVSSKPYYGSAASYNPFPATETPPLGPPSLVGRTAALQLQCLRFIPLLIDFVRTNLSAKLQTRGIAVPPELIRCQIVGSAAVTMLEHIRTSPFPFTSDIDVRIVLNPSLSNNLFAYSTFFKLLEEATEIFLNTTHIFPSATELYGSGAELAPPTLDFVYRTPEDRALLGQAGVIGPLPPHALSPDAPCKGVVLYPIGEARNKALIKIQGRQQIGYTWDSFPVYDDIMDISTNALGNNDEWDAMKDFLRFGGDGWIVPVRPIAQLRRNVAVMKQSPEFTHGARRLNKPKLDARLATLAAIERPEPRKRRQTLRRQQRSSKRHSALRSRKRFRA